MKKIFLSVLLLCLALTTACAVNAFSGIDMEYKDGIYHFTLSGDKIKNR